MCLCILLPNLLFCLVRFPPFPTSTVTHSTVGRDHRPHYVSGPPELVVVGSPVEEVESVVSSEVLTEVETETS